MNGDTIRQAEIRVDRLRESGMEGTAELSEGILALLNVWEHRINEKMMTATKDDLPRLRGELARIKGARDLLRKR